MNRLLIKDVTRIDDYVDIHKLPWEKKTIKGGKEEFIRDYGPKVKDLIEDLIEKAETRMNVLREECKNLRDEAEKQRDIIEALLKEKEELITRIIKGVQVITGVKEYGDENKWTEDDLVPEL